MRETPLAGSDGVQLMKDYLKELGFDVCGSRVRGSSYLSSIFIEFCQNPSLIFTHDTIYSVYKGV